MPQNKVSRKIGTLNQGTLTLTPANDDGFVSTLNGNEKVDVIFDLTAANGTVTFTVYDNISDLIYASAQTAAVGPTVAAYGLVNANFPFLGKGNGLTFAATLGTATTFSADVYAISYRN